MIKHPNILDAGLARGFFVPVARHLIGLATNRNYRRYHSICTRLRFGRNTVDGVVTWEGKRIHFADRESFLSNLGEIFVARVYDFEPSNRCPYILDCGANIGLSSLFWKSRFGDFEGICFEPDPFLADILTRNLKEWGLRVDIVNAALGAKEGEVNFLADGSDAGHVTRASDKGIRRVNCIRLANFLNRRIDLLKIDIEGNEGEVLEDVRDKLQSVERIFVEWHAIAAGTRKAGRVITLLENAGFSLTFRQGIVPNGYWHQPASHQIRITQTLNIYGVRNSPDLPVISDNAQ